MGRVRRTFSLTRISYVVRRACCWVEGRSRSRLGCSLCFVFLGTRPSLNRAACATKSHHGCVKLMNWRLIAASCRRAALSPSSRSLASLFLMAVPISCPVCLVYRLYPDKMFTHRKYFCGEGAQRTEAQAKTQRKGRAPCESSSWAAVVAAVICRAIDTPLVVCHLYGLIKLSCCGPENEWRRVDGVWRIWFMCEGLSSVS